MSLELDLGRSPPGRPPVLLLGGLNLVRALGLARIPVIVASDQPDAVAMASRSPYVEQVQETSQLVADRLSHRRWSVAYQSRSGRPTDPWLEPDIGQAIRDLAAEAASAVIVAPIGFVCDHVEVLYDLDIEARKIAEDSGLRFLRASCPNDHPTFIRMMADVIKTKLASEPSPSA